ncbi:HAD-like domain-containing protein [Baffinella frigidus]|nr:HAD-like domain-containing protein [Cryptophyta sp. CCMP2293]
MSDNRTALGIAAALAAAAGAAWFLKSRSQATKWLESDDVLAWIDRYDTFLLDCDGVVWRGDSVVPGVPEALAALKKRGKKVLYISNNASKHRSAYMSKFKKMGIDACMEDVVTSALGAAKYFVGKYGKGAKVFVCGTEGLIQEFKEAGAHVVEPKYVTSETVCVGGPSMVEPGELDPEIRAIVAGADWNLNHRKISFSVLCLNMIPGCTLICTNRDRLFPAADGLQYPGAGATVAPLEVCSGQKVRAPHPVCFL